MSWLDQCGHVALGHNPRVDHKQEKTGFVCGIEYEIEDIKDTGKLLNSNIFKVVTENDHSLRNNGMEIKTPPQTFDEALGCFVDIHSKIKVGPQAYSDRTSIHVHVNVRDMDDKQAKEVILCYALLEPLFFDFVGDTRKNSIFCVPLNYTYLPDIYRKETITLIKEWHKYTAFNIKPMENFGTMEFRHLYGTGNFDIFEKWLSSIKQLFDFSRANKEFSLLRELANGVKPVELAQAICPNLVKGSSKYTNDLLKDTLLDVKLAGGGFFK